MAPMPSPLHPRFALGALGPAWLVLGCCGGGGVGPLASWEPRAAVEAPVALVSPAPATPAAPALQPQPTEDEPLSDDLAMFGGWGTGGCIGLSTDVRPPACSEPTGCYKLTLMDLSLVVVATTGGVSKATADRSFGSGLFPATTDTVRACFAFELERGRPPTGALMLRLSGVAGACASSGDVVVLERSVGDKTASCVRDALVREQLPSGTGPATIDLAVTMSGM